MSLFPQILSAVLPLKLTSRESSRDPCLQSWFTSWFLFPLWAKYRAGWGPCTPQLALGRDMCLWFFPPLQTFPKASRFRAGILQQHNSRMGEHIPGTWCQHWHTMAVCHSLVGWAALQQPCAQQARNCWHSRSFWETMLGPGIKKPGVSTI